MAGKGGSGFQKSINISIFGIHELLKEKCWQSLSRIQKDKTTLLQTHGSKCSTITSIGTTNRISLAFLLNWYVFSKEQFLTFFISINLNVLELYILYTLARDNNSRMAGRSIRLGNGKFALPFRSAKMIASRVRYQERQNTNAGRYTQEIRMKIYFLVT